jgi:hypothetical protein
VPGAGNTDSPRGSGGDKAIDAIVERADQHQ